MNRLSLYASAAITVLMFFGAFGVPTTTNALTQMDCPSGKLVRMQGWTGWYFTCADSSGATVANPIETETASCKDGYRREKSTTQLESTDAATLGNLCVPDSTPAEGKVQSGPTTCAGTLDTITSPFTCAFRSIVGLFSASLIYLAAWLLAVVGLLFDWLVTHTVISFGAFYGTMKVAIETAWTVFRDIANIIIIGLFVFIAISTILGLEKFGAKKMIARALIIAILINFSLLFTKLIIDASNFTASQFYKAAAFQTASTGTISTGANPFDNQFAQTGIAGQFVNFMGVGSFGKAYDAVTQMAEKNDSGWLALLHGVFSASVLFGAAIVLLYGCYLLVSRAIIIIFLLLSSAIAFATYLVPALSDGKYGWSAWWQALIQAAIFAPLLMCLLWATLLIAKTSKGTVKGSLGDILTSPTNTGNINALFVYLLVLGLLFASLKIASNFSAKVGALNFAAMLPVALGARVAGFTAMQTIGRGSAIASAKFRAAANASDAGSMRASLFSMASKTFGKGAKTDFNLANTSLMKNLAKNAGLSGTFAGQTKGKGFEGWEKSLKENAVKKAEEQSFNKDDIDSAREKAYKGATNQLRDELARETGMSAASISKDGLADMAKAMGEQKKALQSAGEALQKQREAIAKEAPSPAKQTRLNEVDSKIASHAERQKTIEEQDAKIQNANARLKTRAQELLPNNITLDGTSKELASKLKIKAAEEIALKRVTNVPFRIFGGKQKVEDDRIASKMRKAVHDADHHKEVKKKMEEFKHVMDDHVGEKKDDHGEGHKEAPAH